MPTAACRRHAVRGRAGVQGRRAAGSDHRRKRGAPGAGQGDGHRPPLVGAAAEVDAFDAKGRCAGGAGGRRRAGAGCRSCRAGRPGSIRAARAPSRSARRTCSGHFGETASAALEALDAEGPLVAFEVILEGIPRAEAKPTRAKPVLELSRVPAGRARLRLRGRPCREGGRHRARRARRRPQADRRRQRVRRLRGAGHRPGKKSIAIAVTLQPREKTLTDEIVGWSRRSSEGRRKGRCSGDPEGRGTSAVEGAVQERVSGRARAPPFNGRRAALLTFWAGLRPTLVGA